MVVRETIRERPEARGRKLLEVPGYTFHVLVTTLGHDPVQTWRFYNSRAESENRIKELKQDFGADGFCLHSFDGTDPTKTIRKQSSALSWEILSARAMNGPTWSK